MGEEFDVLSYQQREPRIHILTLDRVLGWDIYDRLKNDSKTRFYELVSQAGGLEASTRRDRGDS